MVKYNLYFFSFHTFPSAMQLQLEALQILAKSEAHVSSELPMEDIPFLS